VAAKTVTLQKLVAIAPAGTVDPTPMLYDTTMYSMAGLLGVAFVANSQVRPVDPSLWMSNKPMPKGSAAVPAPPAS